MAHLNHIARQVRSQRALAATLALAFALGGCGSDEGVAGGEAIDGTTTGTDATLGDAAGGDDGAVSDTIGGTDGFSTDGWTQDGNVYPDIAFPDVGPIGCNSDQNCPSSPCAKGICDQTQHVCVNYLAPDGTQCGGAPSGCIGQGACHGGQCLAPAVPCDDGNPCTTDVCQSDGTCGFIAIPGCGAQCNGDFMCDDGNPCTSDICQPETGTCMHSIVPGCTTGCQSDTQCNDGNFCTNDYCKGGSCLNILIPNCSVTGCQSDAQCNDGSSCSIDQCQKDASGVGSCVHYGDLSQVNCCDPFVGVQVCNDGNPCTSDVCAPNYQCMFQPIPGCGVSGCINDQMCDDGIKCSIDKCVFGANGVGTCTHQGDLSAKFFCCDPYVNSITCYDGNNCTVDACGMDYQCTYPIIPGCGTTGCKTSLDCNDGNACTSDMCAGGQCAYGGVTCGSPDPCMTAACDPKTGQCIYTPIPGCGQFACKIDSQCDDGNFCTIDACALSSAGSQCVHKFDVTQPPGLCCDPVSSSIPPCNDGDACTQDMCGPDYMCQYLPIPGCINKCKADTDCAGGDVCTIAKCDVASGVCLYGTIPNCCNPLYCDDGNPCTKDSCDAATGGCINTPIPGCIKPCDPTMCNDYNPCTADACDKFGNCQNLPIPNCVAQFCKSDQECVDSDACTQDVCDPMSNTCQHYQIPGCAILPCKSNAECNDFNACTGDLCLNNQCAHKAVTCDDGNPCTADACDQTSGACSNAPIPGCTATPCKDATMCDDKNPCSLDTCVTGWCNHLFTPGCFGTP